MKVALLLCAALLSVILLSSSARAVAVTGCINITSAGTYTLQNDINATYPGLVLTNDCIYIMHDDVILDLNGYSIIGDGASIGTAIYSNDNDRITIMNGEIRGFINATDDLNNQSYSGLHLGISDGSVVRNVNFANNSISVWLGTVTNSHFYFTADSPLAKIGIIADSVNSSTFSVYSRAQRWGMYLSNSKNTSVSGVFDTNIIEANLIDINTSTGSTNLPWYQQIWNAIAHPFGMFNAVNDYINIPAIINQGTALAQLGVTQNVGFGLVAHNVTDCNFTSISSTGEQGIVLEDYSTKNTLMKIKLPASGSVSYFGGLYLGSYATNNTLCEVDGIVFDYCGGDVNQACPQKQNLYYDSCNSIPMPAMSGNGLASNAFLTPLVPGIGEMVGYNFLTFFTTPFFIAIMISAGVCIWIGAKFHNSTWAMYLLVIMIVAEGVVMVSVWFALIFVVIGFWIALKDEKIRIENPFRRGKQ